MLVLSRREDEQITLPQLGITLTILRVGGRRVQVGVEAPPEIRITRPELFASAEAGKRAEGCPDGPQHSELLFA